MNYKPKVFLIYQKAVFLDTTSTNLFFMAFKKAASEGYIRFKKTITKKEIIDIIHTLKKEWLLEDHEVIYRFIVDSAQREIKKKEQFKKFTTDFS